MNRWIAAKRVRQELNLPRALPAPTRRLESRRLETGEDLDIYGGFVIRVRSYIVSLRHIHKPASQSEPFGACPPQYHQALPQMHSVSNRLESRFVSQLPTTLLLPASRYTRFHSCEMIADPDRWT